VIEAVQVIGLFFLLKYYKLLNVYISCYFLVLVHRIK